MTTCSAFRVSRSAFRKWPPEWWRHIQGRLEAGGWRLEAIASSLAPRALSQLVSVALIAALVMLSGASAPAATAKAAAPANDLISLETDAKVKTKSFRRQLEPEQAAARAKLKRVEKSMNGVVGAKGTNGLSLSFGGTGDAEREMWLPFEAGLKLVGYQDLKEIRQGDMVSATCEQLEDGSELFLKRLTLLRAANAAPTQ